MRRFKVLLSLFMFFVGVQGHAENLWSFDLQTGSAHNFPAPLSFEQGEYKKKITADYSTRPFGGGAAPYYNLRLRRYALSGADTFYSFELLHHKLWLDNRPAEVGEFRMTFGYNPLLFSAGFAFQDWAWLYVGAGPVVAHAMNTVNGKRLPNSPKLWPTGKRYDFVGLAAQVGAEAFWNFCDRYFLNADLKLLLSYAWRVPLADGRAKTLPTSIHAHLGTGIRW